MIALIDGDLIAYPVAASCEKRDREGNLLEVSDEETSILRCDKAAQDILDGLEATHYKMFLSGKNNFRKRINSEYKANRKDKPQPIYLQLCRDFLIREWNAEISEGCEADDLLGINQAEETIICTFDKDLDMIPGLHYNWKTRNIYSVSEIEGLKFFYKQLLIGDKADNIFGVDGIGPVKAAKLIDPLEHEEDMLKVVKELYKDDKRLCINMECLWIWRN